MGSSKVICLWSGGKDSCFAAYKAIAQGYDVVSLFNFTSCGGKDSLSHGLPSPVIFDQAGMSRISIFQKEMPRQAYREEFKRLINKWKGEKGIEGIVFGDIYLQEHKEWIDKVCDELKVKAIMPLWNMDTGEIIEEFVDAGFEAIVVTTKVDLLGKEYLGRKIDKVFKSGLDKAIDPCGEKGEFHTFVLCGPLFNKKIKISESKKILENGRWCLKILKWRVESI